MAEAGKTDSRLTPFGTVRGGGGGRGGRRHGVIGPGGDWVGRS